MTTPPIPDPTASLHWGIVLDELETKQRWAEVCDAVRRRNARPATPNPSSYAVRVVGPPTTRRRDM